MSQQPYLKKHVLVCVGDSCGEKRGRKIRDALKKELRARDLRHFYRDGECTCLGLCHKSVNAVIWPEGVYLAGLTVDDVPRLVDFLDDKGPRLTDLEQNAEEKIAIKKASP